MRVSYFASLAHKFRIVLGGVGSSSKLDTRNCHQNTYEDVRRVSFSKLAMRFSRKIIASAASFAVAFTPIATSFIPRHAYAQQIIIDPSAPSTQLLSSGQGVPQIDIATPNSGVSHNKFSDFNVGADGVILNNSQTRGQSVTGGNVNANDNLATAGPATVILNEVTGTGTSTLTGITEVFGGKAAVIIANPNGIGCNGCNFINTNRTTLATGTPTVTGSDISIHVTQGTLNVGRGGFTTEGSADLVGRHVVVDGQVQADDDLIVSGGSQQFNYNASTSQAAPIVNTKKSPFAVDATKFGALSAGNIRIHGNESGLGVNAYGDLNTAGNVILNSKGDLFYGNIQSSGEGLNQIDAAGQVRQYGDAQFAGDVEISSGSFTLYKDRKLETSGNVSIDASDFVVIVGEIAAQDITIDTASSITNNGFLLADGELIIVAGDDIVNEREIATEYDVYYDPAIQEYLDYYQELLISGNSDEQALAQEFIARAAAHEIIQQYAKKGATLLGENVTLEANLDIDLEALENDEDYTESGDIRNVGGAIIGTRNVVLRAGENIINQSLELVDRLDASEGCDDGDCGYRKSFHSGEILSGGDLVLLSNQDVQNRASNIGAAGNIIIQAGRDIVNTLQSSNYETTGVVGTQEATASIAISQHCEGGGDARECWNDYTPVIGQVDITGFDIGHILAPGQILSLSGDVSLIAQRDIISYGSKVSAGGDVVINAGESLVLSAFAAIEGDYEFYTDYHVGQQCVRDDENCYTAVISQVNNTDTSQFIASASVIEGNNISIAANRDIGLAGVHVFAENDLSIQSVNGSILIDSIDLPDEIIGAESRPVNFVWGEGYVALESKVVDPENGDVELTSLDGDAATLLFRDADLARDFENFIDDNPLLAAVDTLRRVESPNQIREVVRSVGLQSGSSIFEDGIEDTINDLRAELATIQEEIATLQAYLDEQTDLSDADRNAQTLHLNSQIQAATQLTQQILDFETAATSEGSSHVQNGTAVVGEESAAVALANYGFDNDIDVQNKAVDIADEYGLGRDGVPTVLDTGSIGITEDIQPLLDQFDTFTQVGSTITRVSDAGHDVEEILYGDDGKTVKYTDTNNIASWENYIVYRNADGENIAIIYTYDDGSIRHEFYGDTNGSAYDRHRKWYDANGNLTSEITILDADNTETRSYTYTEDGDLLSETIDLTSGGAETINYTYISAGVLQRSNITYASGVSKQINYDHSSTSSWTTYETEYDVNGERTKRTYSYDDETRAVEFFDFDSNEQWEKQTFRYDLDGNLRNVTRYNDDGSKITSVYDLADDKSWDFYSTTYDASGNLQKLTYSYDDNSWVDYYYYYSTQASAQKRQIRTFSTEGVYEKTIYEYNDGRKTIRYYDRDNEEEWNTRTLRYDASGNFISQNYVADVENTLAETNHGKFFNDTKWRFANSSGLAQLASTPRSILYADNDLALNAGQFVDIQVEDKSFSNKAYNRPIDLASDHRITDRTAEGIYDLSSEADAAFPLFEEAVASVVTSETPESENQYTNSTGDLVHRKDYLDGTYTIDITKDGGVRFVNYYNAAGENIARKYFYASGIVRDTVFAVDHTDGDGESNTWTRIDTFYTPEGSLSYIDEYADDGSRVRSNYDAASDKVWFNSINHYDVNGVITSRDIMNDDGTRVVYSYDVGNTEAWERTITRYNYAGQLDTITEELDDAGTIVTTNDYSDTQDWARQIITTQADGTITTSYINDLDNTVAQRQLQGGEQDIYIAGATTVAAGNDVNINASRRLGILGAINTNFKLTGNPHSAFDMIGQNLQLGTLYRDSNDAEVGIQLDADGNPVLDEDGNTIRVVAEDDGEIEDAVIADTRNYRLINTVITSGNDLSINTSSTTDGVISDIVNYGGSIIAGENAYITSDGDIRNEVLRHNFTLTAEHGCFGGACGGEGHDYKPAEILAGSGLIIASGGSVTNYGSYIGAAGAILIAAEEDIINDAITSQYLYHYINSSSAFGLKRRKEILKRAIIQEGNISSTYGSITLDAGRDIKNTASLISAGGDVTLDAGNDIELYAKSEEVHNYVKRRGISFLSISQQETRYNEFGTALSQLEGNAIYASAGNNLTGIGAQLFSATDIVLDTGNNVTFDAHQNIRYRETEGWSFGISFPGSNIIAALVEGGGLEGALDAYIGSNPVLAAVHQVASADNSDQRRNGLINLAYHAPALFSAAHDAANAVGSNVSITEGLAAQLNPFDGFSLDSFNPNSGSFLDGVTFRFSAYQSREEWTESHISQIISGQDLALDAGNDLALVGGTVASAARHLDITASNDVLVAALADTQSSESSSWGASIGFGGGGVTVGGNFSESTSNGILYTNAGITAGETLDVWSGRDIRFAGANVRANNIYIDAGRDLVVQSRQNVSTSQSSGWNFSVSISPAGITGASFGVNGSDSNRQYTDTPTTIVAENTLDIYTEGTTILLGAVLNSETNALKLNTGDFIFTNYNDVDHSESYSAGVSLGFSDNLLDLSNSDAHGSYAYSNTEGVTYATIGLGEITIRNHDNFDLSALNRDVENVQRITSSDSFSIEIPGINLSRWIRQIEDTTEVLQALGTDASEARAIAGSAGVRVFQRLILNGYTPEQARALVGSEEFRIAAKFSSQLDEAIAQYGSYEDVPIGIRRAIANGELILYRKQGSRVVASLRVECGLFMSNCELALDEYERQLDLNPGVRNALIEDSLEAVTAFLAGSDPASPKDANYIGVNGYQNVQLAFNRLILECSYHPDGARILSSVYNQNPQGFLRLASANGQFDPHALAAAAARYSADGNEAAFNLALERAQYPESETLRTVLENGAVFAGVAVGFIPGVGEAQDGYTLYRNLEDGNYYAATATGGLIFLGVIAGPVLDGARILLRRTNVDDVAGRFDPDSLTNVLPSGYTNIGDGWVTGPRGGRAWDTGYTKNGKPVYQRETGGYYTIADDGVQVTTSSPKPHGNTLDNTPTEIYRRINRLEDKYEKTGIARDAHRRYAASELGFDEIEIIGTRPRAQAAKIERFIVERWPGPKNKEPWAGKSNPSHPNYDPDYIPFHRKS